MEGDVYLSFRQEFYIEDGVDSPRLLGSRLAYYQPNCTYAKPDLEP